ncbi:UxaA family hydrolase, partial [Streptomyces sp. NPDC001635]
MKKLVIKINNADNVLVALQDLPAGTSILHDGNTYVTVDEIPAKHKFFMQDMKTGNEIMMYGVLVGKVQFDVKAGMRMNVDNTKHAAEPFAYRHTHYKWEAPDVLKYANRSFNGYHRKNGEVGTANYWLFIPTVFCENRNLDIIKESLYSELGYAVDDKYKSYTHKLVQAFEKGEDISTISFEPKVNQTNRTFKNVDGIKFLTHNGGCGGTRQDADTLSKLLAAYAHHPNVAGITVLSLGCQHLQVADFKRDLFALDPDFDKPLLIFEQQKAQSEEQLIQNAIRSTFEGLMLINRQRREAAPLSKLCVGVKCGGSDGFSGISANPAVGYCADLLVALGARVLLAEFP